MILYSLENSVLLFSPGDWLNAAGALLVHSYFSIPYYKVVNDFGNSDWLVFAGSAAGQGTVVNVGSTLAHFLQLIFLPKADPISTPPQPI